MKVKVIIADLLDILLKLHPTCRFFPLPTVTLDLPVQINLNYVQVVQPKISAELIGLEQSWFWCCQPDLTEFAEKRMGVVDPVRHLAENLPGKKIKESLSLRILHYQLIVKSVTLSHPVNTPPHPTPLYIHYSSSAETLGHKTLLGFWGQWVSLNKSP